MSNKTGFIYYSVDTNRYQDMRIKRLKKDFSCSGIAVYDYLLCEIYRGRGCFIEWDESTAFDVADYFGIKESLVNEIVNYCGVVGLFDKGLLTSGRILTSLSIQKRYFEWSKKAKRNNIDIPNYVKIQEESEILPEETPKLPEELAKIQEDLDKVKKSKVKESKEEKESADFLSKIIVAFQESYFDIFQTEYVVMVVGKERSAAAKLLESYKKKYPQSNSEETIQGLRDYFSSCCKIDDPWMQKNMSLPIIVSKFNEINNSIKNGRNTKPKSVASRSAEIDAIVNAVFDAKGMQ